MHVHMSVLTSVLCSTVTEMTTRSTLIFLCFLLIFYQHVSDISICFCFTMLELLSFFLLITTFIAISRVN